MDPTFSVFLFTFFFEQLMIIRLGSFPYKYGFPVAYRAFPHDDYTKKYLTKNHQRIAIHENAIGEIFLRYKYPLWFGGPYVYVGHVTKSKPSTLIVRIGPLTLIFFIYFLISSLFHGLSSLLVAAVTICFFIWYFFQNLTRNYIKYTDALKKQL